MSDTKNDMQATEDAEFEVEVEVEDSETIQKPKRGNGIAWLALLISALALAAAGYAQFKDWRADDNSREVEYVAKIEDLDRRVDASSEALNALSETLDASSEALAAVDSRFGQISHPDYSDDIDAVRRDVEDQLRLLNSLPSRMTNIEDSVASLVGISAGARQTFLLAEAEYYLQIGNAQLQLANNPHLASLALRIADERVTQLSDPALTAVRRSISDELAALEVMEKPDLEGATLTLASLARVVESLPLASRTVDEDTVTEDDTGQSGVDRAWDSVKDAMSGLVKVTPPDQAKLEFVSLDAEYLLRNNIALQLQSARLALLRGEQAIFEQTLDDTSALLNRYFDTESAQVKSAQLAISGIRGDVFTASVPDISESLRLLRQYRTLSETVE
jgi:uroporphyrin-3 C-methyltransferase